MIYINQKEIDLAKKLKVGDKVKIKSLRELSKFQNVDNTGEITEKKYRLYCDLAEAMLREAGRVFSIVEIRKGDGYEKFGPIFKLSESGWVWTASMFDFNINRRKFLELE